MSERLDAEHVKGRVQATIYYLSNFSRTYANNPKMKEFIDRIISEVEMIKDWSGLVIESSRYLELAARIIAENKKELDEKAEMWLSACLMLTPESFPQIHANLALLHFKKQAYAEALTHQKTAIICFILSEAENQQTDYKEYAKKLIEKTREKFSAYVDKVYGAIKSFVILDRPGLKDRLYSLNNIAELCGKMNDFHRDAFDDYYLDFLRFCDKLEYSEAQIQELIREIINWKPVK